MLNYRNMPNSILQVLIRRGNPERLSGKLLVYARIHESADLSKSHWGELVRGGMVAVTGNYRDQHSLLDFLRRELQEQLGDDVEEGLRQMREKGGDQWEKLQELMKDAEKPGNMEIIPIPAKVVFFESEDDLLQADADIFYMGEFKQVTNAHLSVSAFPILYQAAYREQDDLRLEDEINALLAETGMAEIESESCLPLIQSVNYANYAGDLRDLLYRQLIPELIHRAAREDEFQEGMRHFRAFLRGYPFAEDVEAISRHIHDIAQGLSGHQRHVELLCRKIAALREERFEELNSIKLELSELENGGVT